MTSSSWFQETLKKNFCIPTMPFSKQASQWQLSFLRVSSSLSKTRTISSLSGLPSTDIFHLHCSYYSLLSVPLRSPDVFLSVCGREGAMGFLGWKNRRLSSEVSLRRDTRDLPRSPGTGSWASGNAEEQGFNLTLETSSVHTCHY